MNELAELEDEVRSLANAIRDRISVASKDSQEAWIELDRAVERFRRELARQPEESVAELRAEGFALKRSLRSLHSKIRTKASATPRH